MADVWVVRKLVEEQAAYQVCVQVDGMVWVVYKLVEDEAAYQGCVQVDGLEQQVDFWEDICSMAEQLN